MSRKTKEANNAYILVNLDVKSKRGRRKRIEAIMTVVQDISWDTCIEQM